MATLGIHHVTAICSDAQANYDFYAGVLGLRLVKLTVNFDDPTSHHLYYGDELGRPGSIMTFFAWPGAHRGRVGNGQVVATAFSVPAGAGVLDYWMRRLDAAGATPKRVPDRDGQPVIAFSDPDGMPLELVAAPVDPRTAWTGRVAGDNAIRGFHSVTLAVEASEHTAAVLTGPAGFRKTTESGNRFSFEAGTGGPGTRVDVLCTPDGRHGSMGAGVVHHVAFRIADDPAQLALRKLIAASGRNVSPVMDRTYFHSIYFREPGGVLFEVATDSPGFTVDEPAKTLGEKLMLPPHVEAHRAELERILPKIARR